MVWLILLVASYLIGSIPFGFIVARFKGIDITKQGSGNIGATNVWRTMGPAPGLFVLVMDALKGVSGVMLGRQAGIEGFELLTGMAALLGHAFPVYIGFKGGKIIATGAGVMTALAPPVILVCFVIFAAVVLATRYISLGSICAAISVPVLLAVFHYNWMYILFGAALCLVAILKHIPNIKRLKEGTESRFKFK